MAVTAGQIMLAINWADHLVNVSTSSRSWMKSKQLSDHGCIYIGGWLSVMLFLSQYIDT